MRTFLAVVSLPSRTAFAILMVGGCLLLEADVTVRAQENDSSHASSPQQPSNQGATEPSLDVTIAYVNKRLDQTHSSYPMGTCQSNNGTRVLKVNVDHDELILEERCSTSPRGNPTSAVYRAKVFDLDVNQSWWNQLNCADRKLCWQSFLFWPNQDHDSYPNENRETCLILGQKWTAKGCGQQSEAIGLNDSQISEEEQRRLTKAVKHLVSLLQQEYKQHHTDPNDPFAN